MFKTDVVGTSQGRRNADLTLGPIRASLGRLFEIYEIFDKVICFFFLVVRWTYTWKTL